MKILLTALILLLATTAYGETYTYRWVDDQGVVHYSDKPHEGAERIVLDRAQGFSQAPASTARNAATDQQKDAEAFRYETVEVVSPYEDEVLFNIATKLSVQVSLVPSLRPNHFVTLSLDGKNVNDTPVRGRQFEIDGVYRGTHQAVATIVDGDGKVVQQSPVRTFHVRQTAGGK